MSDRAKSNRRAAGTPPLLHILLLAGLLAIGVVAWEHIVHVYVFRHGDTLLGHVTHALRDGTMAFAVAFVAVIGGLWLAGRTGVGLSSWRRLLWRGAFISLLFLALMVPSVGIHGYIDSALEGETAVSTGVATSTDDIAPASGASFAGSPTGLFTLTPEAAEEGGIEGAAGVMDLVLHGLRDAFVGQTFALPLLIFGLVVLGARSGERLRLPRPAPAEARPAPRPLGAWARYAVRVAPVGLVVVAFLITGGDLTRSEAAHLVGATNACNDGLSTNDRSYDVSAIHVRMTLNNFGDHDPDAYMYALDSRIPAIRAEENASLPDKVSIGLRKDAIQPLIIRANIGECLVINFTNQLNDGRASLHTHGLAYTAINAGSAVGNNPGSTAVQGQTVTYRLVMPTNSGAEGTYYFHDHGASRQRVAHGLFGAIGVEPAGSLHLDPETGQPLDQTTGGNNWEAIIVDPNGIDFREFVIMYHEIGDEDFEGILDENGNELPQQDDVAETYRPASRALNYRSEPFCNRLSLNADGSRPFDACDERDPELVRFKSQGYGSYTFGDPATPVPRSYLGEPTKTRLMHGGSEVFHVHHLHGGADRWRRNPDAEGQEFATDPVLNKFPTQNAHSTRLDSQAIGPGTSFNLEHECAAGGCQQAAGDFLYHCHIGHHYISGMWSFWRVFDTVQNPDLNGDPLAAMPADPDNPATLPQPQDAVNSVDLIGTTLEDGRTVVAPGTAGPGEVNVDDLIEPQLPPPGVRLDEFDATVWNWIVDPASAPNAPLYLGEPETNIVWPAYASPTPGQRPEILFNPRNGRYAWPLFRPHLGDRPPFSANGHTGAPWLGEDGSSARPDGLCPNSEIVPNPNGVRQNRFYPITAIEQDIPIEDNRTDNDGEIFVLSEDIDAVRAGTKPAQPLSIRSNVGDCTAIIFTSELVDGDDDHDHDKVNMHTHFVQFDPQASDGVITGFSYEQSVRPWTENGFSDNGRALTVAASAGDTVITVSQVNRLRTGIWLGVGLAEGMCDAAGQPDPTPDQSSRPCTEIRKIAAINGNNITLDAALDNAHGVGEGVGVEFVQYRWYSDVDSGTIFWHDHVDFKRWDHGLFGSHVIEPCGSTYHDPASGDEVRSGLIVDVHVAAGGNPGVEDDCASVGLPTSAGVEISANPQDGKSFREFMAFTHNRCQDLGRFISNGCDDGTINLRAEPFDDRLNVDSDESLVFSSVRHGDPFTYLPRAYVGDPFVIRNIGVTDMMGALRVTGHRFRQERFADDGKYDDVKSAGISEREDFVLNGGAGGALGYPGDYLYYSTTAREFEGGAWGIIRVHDTQQGDLQPLPDAASPPTGPGFPQQTFTGGDPVQAADPGDPCPQGSTVRSYDVSIFNVDIPADDQSSGSSDTNTVYALAADRAAIQAGTKPVEPLAIRVNDGECLELNLTNDLTVDTGGGSGGGFFGGGGTGPAGNASISLGLLPFDPQGSYGAAIGFNADSTVAPGATRTYRFFADQELGTVVGLDLADPEEGLRGAFAAVVVEPAGATYRHPTTGDPVESGILADIIDPNGPDFREYVALFHDEDREIGQNTMPYPVNVEGFTSISYVNNPLNQRVGSGFRGLNCPGDPDCATVFDSGVHGDPDNIVRAYNGDPVNFRVAAPYAEQPHVFAIEGHLWPLEPNMPGSSEIFSKSMMSGERIDAPLIGGAGGGIDTEGDMDYLFQDHRMPFLEAGLWGLLRVHHDSQGDLLELPDHAVGDATATPTDTPTDTPTPDGTATDTPTPTNTPTPTPTPTPDACVPGNTGFKNPTGSFGDTGGDGDGFERNPQNAFTDGNGFAENQNGAGDREVFFDYGISIPSGCFVTGIEVRLDWWLDSTFGSNSMSLELSWDGGASWTLAKTDFTETTSEHTAVLGSPLDIWGRSSWTAGELSDANFGVRVISNSSSSFRDFFLDWVPVKVHFDNAPSGNCDPAYPTVCIAPPPPDLDCFEIPHDDFTALPPDPHFLDGDGDRVGCETF